MAINIKMMTIIKWSKHGHIPQLMPVDRIRLCMQIEKANLLEQDLHTSPVVSILYLFEASMSFSSRESSLLNLETCIKTITK
jgi:hypothetical protein